MTVIWPIEIDRDNSAVLMNWFYSQKIAEKNPGWFKMNSY